MRVKTKKAISKYLRGFIFLLLLSKGSFSQKTAYAQSTTGCAVQPACLAMLKAELGATVAAPAAQATTISVTTASGATASTTTQAVAGVAVIGEVRLAGITAFYIWNQAQNEWTQEKAREGIATGYV